MASHAEAVLEEIIAVLSANLGAVDLTGRVVIADGGYSGNDPPFLLISPPAPRTTYDANMGEYMVTGRMEWWLFVASTAETPKSRAYAVLDAASAVISALQNAHADPARTTLHVLKQLLPSVLEVLSDGPDMAHEIPLAYGEIVYQIDRTRGI